MVPTVLVELTGYQAGQLGRVPELGGCGAVQSHSLPVEGPVLAGYAAGWRWVLAGAFPPWGGVGVGRALVWGFLALGARPSQRGSSLCSPGSLGSGAASRPLLAGLFLGKRGLVPDEARVGVMYPSETSEASWVQVWEVVGTLTICSRPQGVGKARARSCSASQRRTGRTTRSPRASSW